MVSSQASTDTTDPFDEIVTLLGLRSTRRTRFEAGGAWAVRFPALKRLKFVAVVRGSGWIVLPNQLPCAFGPRDTFLIGDTPYTVTSDPAVPPIDGTLLYATAGHDIVHHGGDETVMLGGDIVGEADEAAMLTKGLPAFMMIPATSPMAATLNATLELLDRETDQAQLGRSVMTARLAEILLVQALRVYIAVNGVEGLGLIGALADPRIGESLRMIHADVARAWTVEALARGVGMSRSAFALRFGLLVGKPPLAYVRDWRMLLARHALAHEHWSIGQLAERFGYASESAFGHAYKRQFGHSPRHAKKVAEGRMASGMLHQ